MTQRADHSYRPIKTRPDDAATTQKGGASRMSLEFDQFSHGGSPWVLRYRIHSKTHMLFWRGPTYILPAIAGSLYWAGWETACFATVAGWLAWFFFRCR
ncbi:hypothetical protein MCP1_240034 [Candidatus Terasakiella magnetica]|nr:hypothetical protein MCP1_240034 [Candidatus Terasakiella magnetica]